MSSVRPSARWRFLLSPRWLAWLGFAIAAVVGMLWLGDWQFRRAESGNALSWGYTFEWPLFAAFAVVFYTKTVIDEARQRRAAASPAAEGSPAAATDHGADPLAGLPGQASTAPAVAEQVPDPELDEYNAYLARLGQQTASRALRGWRR
jgi:DNA-binding transcriptional regulator of glucitol operon